MKIAFLILAHKEILLLTKLIKKLAHEDIDIYVHLDKKMDIDLEKFSNEIVGCQTTILTNRLDVNWGGYSVLKAQLVLLAKAFNTKHYDYFSFISGQDFPIKTSYEIRTFFEEKKGFEFVEHFPLPAENIWDGNGGMHRYQFFWPIDELGFDECSKFYVKQKIEKNFRTMPGGLSPYGGSNWVSITRDCTDYLLKYIVRNPEILPFFSLVVHPEEIFFHTIILNSLFKEKVINRNYRYIDWNSNTPSPRILNSANDFSLLSMSDSLFARKFEIVASNELLAKMGE